MLSGDGEGLGGGFVVVIGHVLPFLSVGCSAQAVVGGGGVEGSPYWY